MTPIANANPASAAPEYRQRLVIHVAWHPKFLDGMTLAAKFYDHFMRDSQRPIARGLGIPVYFRSAAYEPEVSQVPRPIRLDRTHHTAVIALVDDAMMRNADLGWSRYLADLNQEVSLHPTHHRLIGVKFDDDAFTIAKGLGELNFIRPPGRQPTTDWLAEIMVDPYVLLNPVAHELCRLLLGKPELGQGVPPVRVFISHAKTDGSEIAERIKAGIEKNSQLKTFFDTQDIPFGEEFSRVLESAVGQQHSAMLVVQTDDYSTRQWCQQEVLWAKEFGRPVLVLHGVKLGEKCSFPYLGNGPVIRFNPEDEDAPDIKKVLGDLLVEVLRNAHFLGHFEDIKKLYGLGDDVHPLPQTPELLTLLEINANPNLAGVKTIVYQEPPLGEHLLAILRRFVPGLEVTTPLLLVTSKGRTETPGQPLQGMRIGLSISDPPSLARLGFDGNHVKDASVEFARYLLEAGATLAYGGDLRPGGFTEVLRDLVRTYSASESGAPRLIGYLAWPYHRDKHNESPEYKAYRVQDRLKFQFVPKPVDQQNAAISPPIPKDRSPGNLLAYTRCLTAMREQMDGEIDARIFVGGALTGYMGSYPGLAEEVLLAIRSGKPVYLIGGFGGCAAAVIDAIQGNKPESLTADYQFRDADYAEMIRRHNLLEIVPPVDYDSLLSDLETWGMAGLCQSNGLTEKENLRLFETPHVIEMVYLVLRGLTQCRN